MDDRGWAATLTLGEFYVCSTLYVYPMRKLTN